MALNNLHDLFEHELKSMHAGEALTLAALRQALDETRDPEVRRGVEAHARETEEQIRRLEGVLRGLNVTVEAGWRSPVVEGLAEDKRRFLALQPTPEMLETFNVTAMLMTERIEVTCYEGVLELTRLLGAEELAAPLRESLHEEQLMLTRMQGVFGTLGQTGGGTTRRKGEMRRSNVGPR